MADPPPAPSHKIAHTACPQPQKPSTNSVKPFVVSVKAFRISVKAGGTLVSLKRRNGGALQGGATASPCSAFSLGKSVARIRSVIILSTYLQSLESSIKGSTKLGPVKISGGHSLR